MADKVLTWYIGGDLAQYVEGTNVSTEYVLDDDYVPVRVTLRQKVAQAGLNTIVDINDDGTSIFPTLKPALSQGVQSGESNIFATGLGFIAKDSVITLDVDQVSSTVPGSSLSVSLELNKV